jgi:hypothetical protein
LVLLLPQFVHGLVYPLLVPALGCAGPTQLHALSTLLLHLRTCARVCVHASTGELQQRQQAAACRECEGEGV